VVTSKGAPLAAAAKWLGSKGIRHVGIESEHMTVQSRKRLEQLLAIGIRLRDTSCVVEKLRLIKQAGEVALIREAVHLGVRLLDTAIKAIRPGVAETEVAAELEYAARRGGAEAMSFETIVAAGPRSALPHGVASQAAIPARGFVVLDFGVILRGYCSDMTRTVHVGKVSAGGRRMYQAVREAQQAAIGAVRSGIACGRVDQAARKTLHQAGLGRYFTHSTGHGVGLEIHEPPRLGRGQTDLLRSGMVVTVEPGVYVPGKGGIRIEDMVVVTDGGCEILTQAPKDLIEL
jgi:Xaa-Pro aminopeptidase